MINPQRKFIHGNWEELAAFIQSSPHRLVAFDGRPGAGKTHQQKLMAEKLGFVGFDGDDYVTKGQGRFLEAMKIDRLRSELRQVSSAKALLSTVCARAVVEHVGLYPATFVYIEPSSTIRFLQSERDFDEDVNRDVPSQHPLYAEVELYHREYSPRSKTDAVYLWANEW